LQAPAPYGARLKAVDRPYLDTNGLMWTEDRAYVAGGYGFSGGTQFMSGNPIANTTDDILFQAERYAGSFSVLFDAPNGVYETQLLEAETADNNPGDRLINVTIEGQQVLTNFDIFAAAGGKNRAVTRTFTNTVTDGQLKVDLVGTGSVDPNARLSAIAVRKIAELDSNGNGMPDWWEAANNVSDPLADPDGDGVSNFDEFRARTNPHDSNSALILGPGVTWPSVPGKMYRVQYSDNLPVWTTVVPDILATGNTASWIDPGPLPDHRFYRVQPLP
jgi:hypothetical protein